MAELMPRGGSECCASERLSACCDPIEKEACCGAQADSCDCAEGKARGGTIIITRVGLRAVEPQTDRE